MTGDYIGVQHALEQNENPNLLNEKTTYPLSVASFFGHEAIAELLLRSGASVTVKDTEWLTPLHWACYGGHDRIISLLLDNRAEINSRDKFWLTPVHCAAINGSIKSMEVISVKSSNLKITDRYGRQPIHFAALFANNDIIVYLVQKGISVDTLDKHFKSPLHYAAYKGHYHTFELLLSKSADIHLKDLHGRSVIHYAAISGNSNLVSHIVSLGISPNEKTLSGTTPFHLASMYLNVNVCEILTTTGCDVHSKSFIDQNAYHYFAMATPKSTFLINQLPIRLEKAFSNKFSHLFDSAFMDDEWDVRVEAMFNYLLDLNICHTTPDVNGIVPLHLATINNENVICKYLLSDTSKNLKCKNGQTIIHLAASLALTPLCSIFFSSNVDSQIPDDLGRLPLHMAVISGDLDCMKLFINDESKSKLDNNNRGIIFYAVMSGNINAIKFLMDFGYNLMSFDNHHATPLHYAARFSNNPKLISFLLDNDMNLLFIKDNFGYTPLEIAVFNEDINIFTCLLKFVKNTTNSIVRDSSSSDAIHSLINLIIKHDKHEHLSSMMVDCKCQVDCLMTDHELPTSLVQWTSMCQSNNCLEVFIEQYGFQTILSSFLGPLQIAALNNLSTVWEFFIEKFDDNCFKIVDKYQRNLLFYAVQSNNPELIDFLMDYCEIDHQDYLGLTAFHFACFLGNLEILNKLVEIGASHMIRDSFKRLPIFYAAMNNHNEVLDWFLSKFEMPTSSTTSLSTSPIPSSSTSSTASSMLLKKDVIGLTSIHWMALKNHQPCLQSVISHNSKLLMMDSKFPVLHCIVLNGCIDLFKLFLSSIEDFNVLINVHDCIGRNILHVIASNNHISLADYVIQTISMTCSLTLQSFINCMDHFRRTPLHLAAFSSSIDIINLFNEWNNVNYNIIDKNGDTPLHISCRRCSDITTLKLLQNTSCFQLIDWPNSLNIRPLDYIHYNKLNDSIAYIDEIHSKSLNDTVRKSISFISNIVEDPMELSFEVMKMYD